MRSDPAWNLGVSWWKCAITRLRHVLNAAARLSSRLRLLVPLACIPVGSWIHRQQFWCLLRCCPPLPVPENHSNLNWSSVIFILCTQLVDDSGFEPLTSCVSSRCTTTVLIVPVWLQRRESNPRPPGYEPDQIPLLTLCVYIYYSKPSACSVVTVSLLRAISVRMLSSRIRSWSCCLLFLRSFTVFLKPAISSTVQTLVLTVSL